MTLSDLRTGEDAVYEADYSTSAALLDAVTTRLHNDGWCLLRPVDASADHFLAFAREFGTIQRHIRADAAGLVGPNKSVDQSWKEYRSEYIGVDQGRMDPHTDGSFLAGALSIDGRLHHVDPPAVVLLQCVEPAYSGGHHLVVDGQAVVERLMATDPELVRMLTFPGCVTVCRDDQISRDIPVLSSCPDGSLRVRFRYDSKTYAPPEALPALQAFHRLTCDPDLLHTIEQRAGETLIIDNHRALHGRTAFENHPEHPQRTLRRAWIREHRESPLVGVEDQPTEQRILADFANYGPVESMNAHDPSPLIRTGIQID
jgi:alpha-ketoglutarate-dependent taurine dioxygenase